MNKKNVLIVLIVVFSVILLLYAKWFVINVIFPPHRNIPNKCHLTSGLSCVDAQVYSKGIIMRITNSLGYDIQNITLSYTKCVDEDGVASGRTILVNGQTSTYSINCSKRMIGKKSSTNLHFNYTITNNMTSKSVSGVLIQRVEAPAIPTFGEIFVASFPYLVFIVLVTALIVLSKMLKKENLKNKKIK